MSEIETLLNELRASYQNSEPKFANTKETWNLIGSGEIDMTEEELKDLISQNPYSNV